MNRSSYIMKDDCCNIQNDEILTVRTSSIVLITIIIMIISIQENNYDNKYTREY